MTLRRKPNSVLGSDETSLEQQLPTHCQSSNRKAQQIENQIIHASMINGMIPLKKVNRSRSIQCVSHFTQSTIGKIYTVDLGVLVYFVRKGSHSFRSFDSMHRLKEKRKIKKRKIAH